MWTDYSLEVQFTGRINIYTLLVPLLYKAGICLMRLKNLIFQQKKLQKNIHSFHLLRICLTCSTKTYQHVLYSLVNMREKQIFIFLTNFIINKLGMFCLKEIAKWAVDINVPY